MKIPYTKFSLFEEIVYRLYYVLSSIRKVCFAIAFVVELTLVVAWCIFLEFNTTLLWKVPMFAIIIEFILTLLLAIVKRIGNINLAEASKIETEKSGTLLLDLCNWMLFK